MYYILGEGRDDILTKSFVNWFMSNQPFSARQQFPNSIKSEKSLSSKEGIACGSFDDDTTSYSSVASNRVSSFGSTQYWFSKFSRKPISTILLIIGKTCKNYCLSMTDDFTCFDLSWSLGWNPVWRMRLPSPRRWLVRQPHRPEKSGVQGRCVWAGNRSGQ